MARPWHALPLLLHNVHLIFSHCINLLGRRSNKVRNTVGRHCASWGREWPAGGGRGGRGILTAPLLPAPSQSPWRRPTSQQGRPRRRPQPRRGRPTAGSIRRACSGRQLVRRCLPCAQGGPQRASWDALHAPIHDMYNFPLPCQKRDGRPSVGAVAHLALDTVKSSSTWAAPASAAAFAVAWAVRLIASGVSTPANSPYHLRLHIFGPATTRARCRLCAAIATTRAHASWRELEGLHRARRRMPAAEEATGAPAQRSRRRASATMRRMAASRAARTADSRSAIDRMPVR